MVGGDVRLLRTKVGEGTRRYRGNTMGLAQGGRIYIGYVPEITAEGTAELIEHETLHLVLRARGVKALDRGVGNVVVDTYQDGPGSLTEWRRERHGFPRYQVIFTLPRKRGSSSKSKIMEALSNSRLILAWERTRRKRK